MPHRRIALTPSPRPPIERQQLSLLPALARPMCLSVDERLEAIALLATLLTEAVGLGRQEATDDERN